MAMTPEAKVKKQVTTMLRAYSAYYFYPVAGGFGSVGIPDIIACYKGRFIGIECKAGSNKPTALQQKNLDSIRAADGVALVINEANLGALEAVLNELRDPPFLNF